MHTERGSNGGKGMVSALKYFTNITIPVPKQTLIIAVWSVKSKALNVQLYEK
jgi:hypothetical protein